MTSFWLFFHFLALCGGEVLLNTEESVFTLSPSVDIIAFSNFTTNNPLDNLKDFPDTWHPDFDIHEFSLSQEGGESPGAPDQEAVETQGGEHRHPGHPGDQGSNSSVLVSTTTTTTTTTYYPTTTTTITNKTSTTTVSTTSTTTTTQPNLTPPPHGTVEGGSLVGGDVLPGSDAFSSLYEGVGVEWSDTPSGEVVKEEEDTNREFDNQLYEVVTAGTDEEVDLAEVDEEETESEDEKYQNLRDNLQRKYGEHGHSAAERYDHLEHRAHPDQHDHPYVHDHMEKMKHPLIMLMKIEPHALDLLVKPHTFIPGTMVRLMYERVPRNRPPLMQHLDDPVVEYVPLHWPAQHHRLQNLPMGKYIVCGEAHKEGEVIQANCFETVIDRLDSNMLQGGVVGVICVAIISIFLVIVYAIYYRLTRSKRRQEKQGNLESSPS